MTGGGGGDELVSLEFAPTWVVALVCTAIVAVSFAAERGLHYTGKFLINKKQCALYDALQKIKEELMLLGFISLLLTVCQDSISKICIAKNLTHHWLPCKKETTNATDHCEKQGKATLLSLRALYDLHIFIFVLAVVHVAISALTILFGSLQIRKWKQWEDAIQLEKEHDPEQGKTFKVILVHQHSFIRARFQGSGKYSTLLCWVHSFLTQFYGSVNKSDYITLRLGFIMNHYRDNHKFNFYKYMVRALETDFKTVVGISWYMWVFVVVFLFLNVRGWHAYFYISFIPLILLLVVGTKLEHIITQLAEEVAQKHTAMTEELVVKPSDHYFWFDKPRLVLVLIHIIIFQNSFEIAIFFWMLVLYSFNSCIMGQVCYLIPRLVIGVLVQFLCSYSTLPLYAIVTHMGSSFNKAIFEEHIQVKLALWAETAKRNKDRRKDSGGSSQVGNNIESLTTVPSKSTLGHG